MSRITKQMLYDFRADFNRLLELKNSELWQAGKQVRKLRPELN